MWLSVALPTDARHADALSDALMERGALSVSVEDAQAGTPDETPQFGEPGCPTTPLWRHSRVIALFDGAIPLDTLTAQLAAACRASGIDMPDDIEIEDVAEENWVQLTQAQFDPIRINERLWIVPSWHEPPDPAAVNLLLDPGMAFGTGSHPTTRLCLEWLCGALRGGESVLDYGCGSGILAIAAARLGAAPVLGVDIDENALAAARDNAAANRVELALRHSREPLEETFDCVVANILTNPLCVLAPLLAARVAPGGRLVLSGVLESQSEQVIAAYAPFIALRAGAVLDGWVRLEGERPAAAEAGQP
ncbi:methylase for 50S ribosomal subunit protein L11 [Sterolibacterium denitrificans]|uniref:Methylase for 50S ribosomal subunit protein L11 n=2 Tax=Sterolibacterium denitrificans TaxID=157592 RepID=A0A7Z7MU10_9PROT|nr:50S ribosomal protein L11 methyltransferase [Sterolibacterium denitrificans]KYC29047.1 ribosomal protein L11 methyltransferase [Sterolibacterium denitrificans]SMB21296.1 methylase for 50S ribosomal subunit protein L11 [Sterolibacterium denitrificans]